MQDREIGQDNVQLLVIRAWADAEVTRGEQFED
ncbi:Uncharacterised protein [Mycobacteroides abscessus subsp. massiliense]|nr:Uncharacterised protein [Mycobacteroides abscessus subsp. massiliense]